MNIDSFKKITLEADVCVVGGGMAGVCAAVAAARHGAQTVLVQDRPMLGGNASSEIRMWICGAHGENMKESGLIEEIQLENIRWNPSLQYNIWDHVLMNFVQREPNITLLLNTSCDGVAMDGNRIKSIDAWQLTSQRKYEITAKIFADCSGDSVLRVSGAEYRMGREAKSEFNESHAPDVADNRTMGSSILIQTKQTKHHKPFDAPPWAHVFEEKGFHRSLNPRDNFWWMETGGEQDTIDDAEEIRDELLRIAYGVWNILKNSRKGIGREFDIEWIGVLPGKRENVRYVGDYVLNQNDIEKQGKFNDIIAYGGWTMDDHHPAAFYHMGAPTVFHPAPSPFGIPFRSLYSVNIENLMFAGRNISCTHMAMSATRVMATCSLLGQAVGTAAAIAVADGITPRDVYFKKLQKLQAELMDDDCICRGMCVRYLLCHARASFCDGENAENVSVLHNGVERAVGRESNCFETNVGAAITYEFEKSTLVRTARIVFDSDLFHSNGKKMLCTYSDNRPDAELPEELVKEFSIEIKVTEDGSWQEYHYCEDNFKRLVKVPIGKKVWGIRLIPQVTWGCENARIYSFDVK